MNKKPDADGASKDLPRVITIPEVARELKISPNSAYQAARRGEIPIIRIGRRVLVVRAALDRMLAAEEG